MSVTFAELSTEETTMRQAAMRPTAAQTPRQIMIAQMGIAEEMFKATMNFINHSDSSFEDKQEWAFAYIQAFALWRYNAHMIQDALESANPAYEGMTQYRTCGMRFFMKRGALQACPDNALYQEDVYLNIATGIKHTLAYSVTAIRATIALDGAIVWTGKAEKVADLYSRGENLLLVKLGAIPF